MICWAVAVLVDRSMFVFFQAEDGIRDYKVTGVQTCALPIFGSSPEVHLRVRERTAELRPIAGTYPRGKDLAEDERFAADLIVDPKERAEHVMLIDLGRNDLGRVADFGSVRVTEQMVIERYSHVMHIVSHIVARLREGKNAFDARSEEHTSE